MLEITRHQHEALCREPVYGMLAILEPRFKATCGETRIVLSGETFAALKDELKKHTPKENPHEGESPLRDWWYGPVTELRIGCLIVSKSLQTPAADLLLKDYRQRLRAALATQGVKEEGRNLVLREADSLSSKLISLLS